MRFYVSQILMVPSREVVVTSPGIPSEKDILVALFL